MAWIARRGSKFQDILHSNGRDDMLYGLDGNDILFDAGRYGQQDGDLLHGGRGHDIIRSHWGSDILRGDTGNDLLVSRSDAGEPDIAQHPGMPKVNPHEPLAAANDTLNGGLGADTFLFRLDINAAHPVLASYADSSGEIDWAAMVGDGGTPHHRASAAAAMDDPHAMHHHWVEGIGTDTIQDFYRSEGDRIVIEGYSVSASIIYQDTNGDGRDDMSIIRLVSDQDGMGPHDGDALGVIRVYGDFVTMADLRIDSSAHHGAYGALGDQIPWVAKQATAGDDVLRSAAVGVKLSGLAGDDVITDGGRRGDKDRDVFDGGEGNDIIRTRWGHDTLKGGNGDDILVSRSDAGEPEIAQTKNIAKYYPNQPYLAANDVLNGGLGADTFYFRLDLNGRPSVVARHTDADGDIDWHGVAGENQAVHLHWVDSIGTDTIQDFYRAEGDRIVIDGHTAKAFLSYADTNGDRRPDMSIITLRSNQGGSGSHDRDLLGTIRVYGNLVAYEDLEIDAGAHYGAYGSPDEHAMM